MLTQQGDDVLVRVRVVPRARADELAGRRSGALLVRVTAPPVDGKANAAVCRLLARAAGVAPSRLHIERGETGRDKVVRVAGTTVAQLAGRLSP